MSEKDKPSPRMVARLGMVAGWEWQADRENEKRKRQGRFRRMLRGRVAKPDRTDFALEKRGLLDKTASAPGLLPGEFLWTLTEEGRKHLDANS